MASFSSSSSSSFSPFPHAFPTTPSSPPPPPPSPPLSSPSPSFEREALLFEACRQGDLQEATRLLKNPLSDEEDGLDPPSSNLSLSSSSSSSASSSSSPSLNRSAFKSSYPNPFQRSPSRSSLSSSFPPPASPPPSHFSSYFSSSLPPSLSSAFPSKPNLSWHHPSTDQTFLHVACEQNQLPIVRLLLSDWLLNPNEPLESGETPLHVACSLGLLEIVDALLEDPRVDPNRQDENKFTPFSLACLHGHVAVVSLMLAATPKRKKIDVNLPHFLGGSPLFVACSRGHVEVVRELVGHEQVEVNQVDNFNTSSLVAAVGQGDHEVVEALLGSDRLVDTQLRRTNGMRAGDFARRMGDDVMVELLERYERDPVGVRGQIQLRLGVAEKKASEMFALAVFLSDGYLTPKRQTPKNHSAINFLKILRDLPMDLQMVMSNRLFWVGKEIISLKATRKALVDVWSLLM